MAPSNVLPIHGNEKTMNLNTMILTNIQSSPYFKVKLYELKTYHEVIDEIYYKVQHLEPWEKGSRKTAGQTGMCGGVRGVGAGGIVSSAYCLLYKLFTLRLTRKQLNGLLTHSDSPYIRALGFMYIRYSQPPADFWDWFEEYLGDEEEIDVKAGGGHIMTIGDMIRGWMSKLEWYSTLFPRIPVPIQKMLETNLRGWEDERGIHGAAAPVAEEWNNEQPDNGASEQGEFGEAGRRAKLREGPPDTSRGPTSRGRKNSPPFDIAARMGGDKDRDREKVRRPDRDHQIREKHRSRSRERYRSPHRRRSRSRERKRSRSRERKERRRSRSRDRERKRSRDRYERRRSPEHRRRERSRSRNHESSFERDLKREKDRHKHKHRSSKHRDSD